MTDTMEQGEGCGEKFTPGPWRVSGVSMEDGSISVGHDEYRIVIASVTNAASFGDFVAAAFKGRTDFGAPDTAKTQWANARLIASAPELYEALKNLLDTMEGPSRTPLEDIEIAICVGRAALLKASGGKDV
jgi:hypothetical protein